MTNNLRPSKKFHPSRVYAVTGYDSGYGMADVPEQPVIRSFKGVSTLQLQSDFQALMYEFQGLNSRGICQDDYEYAQSLISELHRRGVIIPPAYTRQTVRWNR